MGSIVHALTPALRRHPRPRYLVLCVRCLCAARALCSGKHGGFAVYCGVWATLLTQKKSRQRTHGQRPCLRTACYLSPASPNRL